MSKIPYNWHRLYGGNRVKSPPENGGHVLMVFKTTSVYIPGDERSRTHPGHGYPERTEMHDTFEIYLFEDKEKWAAALTELYKEDPYRVDVWAFTAGLPAKPKIRWEL